MRGWVHVPKDDGIRLCKFTEQDMPTVILTLEVTSDLKWHTSIKGREITIPHTENLPSYANSLADILTILEAIDQCNICTGVNNPKYGPIVAKHEGVFCNQQGVIIINLYYA